MEGSKNLSSVIEIVVKLGTRLVYSLSAHSEVLGFTALTVFNYDTNIGKRRTEESSSTLKSQILNNPPILFSLYIF